MDKILVLLLQMPVSDGIFSSSSVGTNRSNEDLSKQLKEMENALFVAKKECRQYEVCLQLLDGWGYPFFLQFVSML